MASFVASTAGSATGLAAGAGAARTERARLLRRRRMVLVFIFEFELWDCGSRLLWRNVVESDCCDDLLVYWRDCVVLLSGSFSGLEDLRTFYTPSLSS